MLKDNDIYEIDFTKRYILQLDNSCKPEDVIRIKQEIIEWKSSDNTFLILSSGIKLVKIDNFQNSNTKSGKNA